MGDVTNLDARRESKKTTLEKIEAVLRSPRLKITRGRTALPLAMKDADTTTV